MIGRWLENTAYDCENNITQRLENIQIFSQLLASSQRFTPYFQAEEEFSQQQTKFNKNKLKVETNFKNQEKSYNETVEKQNNVESLIAGLENILNTVPNINWEAPEVTDFCHS